MNECSNNSFLSVGKNGFAELTHGSLFSGVGGFEEGSELAGTGVVFAGNGTHVGVVRLINDKF